MSKPLRINFIGNYQSNYVGEIADETHLVRELREMGHEVIECPRDIWKAMVDGYKNDDWIGRMPEKADINIICKWHHFNDPMYISKLKKRTGAPVAYWTWDFMDYDGGWHEAIAKESDLFLTNEGGKISDIRAKGINAHYFNFDVADREVERFKGLDYKYDVAFFGSYVKKGDRIKIIEEINKKHKVVVFGFNHEAWADHGVEAHPPIYGSELAIRVSQSKIVLGINVDDHCWGYWSNRIGKMIGLGAFLLQRYVPGMEVIVGDLVTYFSTAEEAIEKIDYFLSHEDEMVWKRDYAYAVGKQKFTSNQRVKELTILLDRFLKGAL